METYGLYIMLGINVLLIVALVIYHFRYRRLKKIKEDAIDFWSIQCFLLEADINYLVGDRSMYRDIVKALDESIKLHSPKPPPPEK